MDSYGPPILYADFMKRWDDNRGGGRIMRAVLIGIGVLALGFLMFGCSDTSLSENPTRVVLPSNSAPPTQAFTSIDGLQGKIDVINPGVGASAWVRNTTNESMDVALVARKFESPGGGGQSLYDYDVERVDPGKTVRLFVNLSECKTELELIRGDENTVKNFESLNYIDVAYAGTTDACGFDTCPANAPYLWKDGACHTGPPHDDPPPENPNPPDDDGEEEPPCVGNDCEPPPPPTHDACIYEIAKPKNQKQSYCEALSGLFSSHDGSDHCIFGFPGISDPKLNLAPGLSDPDCLRKQDN